MEIVLDQVGKRYRFEWIFRKLDYTFKQGGRYAILGSNGSGKSTLMKILSGHLTPSKGKIQFKNNGKAIPPSQVYRQLNYAAPYIELVEEFTLREALSFHQKFKSFRDGQNIDDILHIVNLPKSATHKEIRHYSSGMKQRVKLVLALLTESSLILLDEPTTNLDAQGISWYLELMEKFGADRNIIVASNEERDYAFCQDYIQIQDYKQKSKP